MPANEITDKIILFAIAASAAVLCFWQLYRVRPPRSAAGRAYHCSFADARPTEGRGGLVARFDPVIGGIAGATLLIVCALLFLVGGIVMGQLLFLLYALLSAACALPLLVYGSLRVLVYEGGLLQKNILKEEFIPFSELDTAERQGVRSQLNKVIAYAYVFTAGGRPVLRMDARRFPGLDAIEQVLAELGYTATSADIITEDGESL